MSALLPLCTVSTPGRICLFGEHQDYLLLPVIPCAISLRLTITGRRRGDREVRIDLPDVASRQSFSLDGTLAYEEERDYFRSVVNVMRRRGFTFSSGFDCTVRGAIPINAGTSSSSAMVVSWARFLSQMSDQQANLSGLECGRIAHEAEVLEFDEPGGAMDQYSTAIGGAMVIDFAPAFAVTPLSAPLRSFVLGDSGEAKDTKAILSRVKNRVLDIVRRLTATHPAFSLLAAASAGLAMFTSALDPEESNLLAGTVRNHEITAQARQLLSTLPLDHRTFGRLLNEHQAVLRDTLRISTPKIDRMIEAALASGAYGAKINGSGGGGCMFAYAPDHPERVAAAVEQAGGRAYVITVDEGTRVEAEP
jgi:galactokinase